MITEQVEIRMSEERARRNKQRRDPSHLISIKDFRLMPNVPRLGGQDEERDGSGKVTKIHIAPHPDYRPYMGDVRATYEERKRIVETGSRLARPAVVDTGGVNAINEMGSITVEDQPPFDVGKATREELKAFAMRWFGASVDPTGDLHLMKLRAQVRDLAKTAAGAEDLS